MPRAVRLSLMRLVAWHLPTSLSAGGNGQPNRSSSEYSVRYHSLPIVCNLSFNSCISASSSSSVVSAVSAPQIKNFLPVTNRQANLETWSRTYFGQAMSDNLVDWMSGGLREAISYFRWGVNRRRASWTTLILHGYVCRWAWRRVVYKLMWCADRMTSHKPMQLQPV